MLHYEIVFLIVALIAAVFGFGGIAAGAAGNRQSAICGVSHRRGSVVPHARPQPRVGIQT
jgi:hypothetical protein